jgi:hypothetical protein
MIWIISLIQFWIIVGKKQLETLKNKKSQSLGISKN